MTKPVLAAVNGLCCGAGLDLVTTGDIAIASERAEFFDPHVSIGLVSGREMVRLARVLPLNVAMRVALMGRHERMSAQRAYELGLVSEVVAHDRLLARAREIAALVNRNAPLAVRGTRLAIRKGLDLPLHEAEILAEAFRERVAPHRRREGGAARRSSRSATPSGSAGERRLRDDPLRDDARPRRDDHARTGPRCSTPSTARCARRSAPPGSGSRPIRRSTPWCCAPPATARSAPGSTRRRPTASPTTSGTTRTRASCSSPKWQKVWKPVVCAVQGMCTAGAFYFVNEADIVICSAGRDVLRLARDATGMVSALEPVGLMRRIGLGETLRIALSGNDERVSAETALRIGLVTEVVARDRALGRARTRSRPASPRKPTAATQGTVRAIWESLDRPYRAAMEQGLIYTRLGNPIGMAEVDEKPPRAAAAEDPLMSAAAAALGERIAAVLAIDPAAPALEFDGRWRTWGELAATVGVRGRAAVRPRARGSACCCATVRPQVGVAARRAARRRLRRHDQPAARRRARPPRDRGARASRSSPASRRISRCSRRSRGRGDPALPRATSAARSTWCVPRRRSSAPSRAASARPGVAVQMLTSGTTGPPKRIDLAYEMLERVAASGRSTTSRSATPSSASAAASRSSTRRSSTSAACSASSSA